MEFVLPEFAQSMKGEGKKRGERGGCVDGYIYESSHSSTRICVRSW